MLELPVPIKGALKSSNGNPFHYSKNMAIRYSIKKKA